MNATSAERIMPKRIEDAEPSHLVRYKFALRLLTPDLAVLDVPCGAGYGTALLSSRCRIAYGVDIDEDAIRHAKTYFSRTSNSFHRCNIEDMKRIFPKNASIDAIVSFEGIEHLHDPESFLAEARRLLKPEGFMMISTPRKPHGSPFHAREYSLEEYKELLSGYFRINSMFGQIFKEIFNLSKRDINPPDDIRFNYIAYCSQK